jgi:hypothetical protein
MGETRSCENCAQEFRIEPDDFVFYQKIRVPPPTRCPHCRMIRRFLFRNNRLLFRRREEREGKEIFSGFPPGAPVKVYDLPFWNSDGWEPMSYGRDYDFSRPFFEQFRELLGSVPLPSRGVINMVNSDYCDHASDMRNSYLCFDGSYVENSAYLVGSYYVKECFDLYESRSNELSYESVQIDECYRAFFSFDCEASTDIWFSKDLVGCSNCFGCVNLRKKSYHIFNRPYGKEEYFEKLKEFNVGSFASLREIRKKAEELWLQFPVKYFHGWRNVGSSGEHIQNAKKAKNCYCIHGGENLSYSQFLEEIVTDSYDYTIWGMVASLMYECLECGMEDSRLKFCWDCWPVCRDLEYCISCRSSSDCFGCIGIKKKQFCILNKQYSREDYLALREKIIRQMDEMPYADAQGKIYRYGEFFPPEFSPFAYNETIAQDFFPLSVETAVKAGHLWREPEAREYRITINAGNLPDHIKDADGAVLKEVIACSSCGRAYRLIPMELAFYRRVGIPLPRECVNCRFAVRLRFVNPPKYWSRACQCAGSSDDRRIYRNVSSHFHGSGHCPNEFETSYAPERPEIVYCEACYQSEVV